MKAAGNNYFSIVYCFSLTKLLYMKLHCIRLMHWGHHCPCMHSYNQNGNSNTIRSSQRRAIVAWRLSLLEMHVAYPCVLPRHKVRGHSCFRPFVTLAAMMFYIMEAYPASPSGLSCKQESGSYEKEERATYMGRRAEAHISWL